MKAIVQNILNSFSTNSLGWSARKLSAFAAFAIAGYVTIFQLQPDDKLHATYAWQTVGLMFLGFITADKLITLRNGRNITPTSNTGQA